KFWCQCLGGCHARSDRLLPLQQEVRDCGNRGRPTRPLPGVQGLVHCRSGAAPPSEAGILTVEPVVEGSGGVPSGRVVQPSSQPFVRTIVLLCGLLGAGACATLGFLWWTAQVNMKEQVDLARLFMQGGAADPAIQAELNEFDNRARVYPHDRGWPGFRASNL